MYDERLAPYLVMMIVIFSSVTFITVAARGMSKARQHTARKLADTRRKTAAKAKTGLLIYVAIPFGVTLAYILATQDTKPSTLLLVYSGTTLAALIWRR